MTHSLKHRPTDPLAFLDLWDNEGLPVGYETRLESMGVLEPAGWVGFAALVDELTARCARRGAHVAVDGFLATGDSFDERVDRRATVLLAAQLSGASKAALPWPGLQPAADPNTRRRVLTDIERALVRFCACTSDACAVTIGAADAGAASGELQRILAAHVGHDGVGLPDHLLLPGNERAQRGGGPSGAAPRTNELPMWRRRRYARHLQTIFTDRPVLYAGSSSDPGKIQSSILVTFGKVVTMAGLRGDATVEPMSIRNTAGRAVRDAHGIEAAARFLGHHDLNIVSREIGVSLHPPVRVH